MFLTETFLRVDLFLTQGDLAGLGTTGLHESYRNRLVGNSIHYAVDSIGRRRRHRTCGLTRNLELNSELSTYKEVVQFGVAVQGKHSI